MIRFHIEADLKDKEAALDIDSQTLNLKVTGPEKKKEKEKGGQRYPIEKKVHH